MLSSPSKFLPKLTLGPLTQSKSKSVDDASYNFHFNISET